MTEGERSVPGAGSKLWGGRFEGGVHPVIDQFTRALGFDRRLARFDLIGCLAHARMLLDCEVIERADAEAILGGLSELLSDVEQGLEVDGPDEDVHSWIERTLIERIGEPARRLHTGRSRNDQVAVAVRLFVRSSMLESLERLQVLESALIESARGHLDTLLPGYTHLQRAQPVSLAHHLLAHFWSFADDAERLQRVHRLAGRSPLGAGAMAGTPHAIDPLRSAALLGMPATFDNSMHAVADRDYLVETSASAALTLVHLSRWAAEVVLWTSQEFGFARLSDSVAKGSSIMPQKRNPEPAEILRGKSGRVIGDLTAHLTQLKGLPLTYFSDLQEDKEALFDAVDTLQSALRVASVLFAGLEFQPERMRAALSGGFITATDLADALVRRGVAFRSAHEQTGRAVAAAEGAGVELWQLPIEELQRHCPEVGEEVLEQLQPERSVEAHASWGGPAPRRVAEQLERAERRLGVQRAFIGQQPPPPIYRAHLDGDLLDDQLARHDAGAGEGA